MRSKRISRPDSLSFSAVFVVIVSAVLIIGMSAPQAHHGSSVDLAKTYSPISMPAADRDDALVLAITRDGTMFLGSKQVGSERVSPGELSGKIRERLTQRSERKIYIKADARVGYKWVKTAIDAIHDAGIEDVAFLTEQRKGEAQ